MIIFNSSSFAVFCLGCGGGKGNISGYGNLVLLILYAFFKIPSFMFSNFKSSQQIKLIKVFKAIKDVQKKKFSYILAIVISTFVVTFYLSFNYCSVLYYSRWLFVECLFVGILMDFVFF